MKAIVSTILATAAVLTASAAMAQDDEILLGLIAGTTGAYGAVGVAVVNGTQMAVDEVNAAGGVLGKQIKLEWVQRQGRRDALGAILRQARQRRSGSGSPARRIPGRSPPSWRSATRSEHRRRGS